MRKYQIKYRKLKKKIGYETFSPWVRNVQHLGTNRPDFGYETSKSLGTNRPTWVRIVLGTKRPGHLTDQTTITQQLLFFITCIANIKSYEVTKYPCASIMLYIICETRDTLVTALRMNGYCHGCAQSDFKI